MRPLVLRNVLVATDLSEALLPALRTALELARLTGARVHVVHVDERNPDQLRLGEQVRAAGLGRELLGDVRALQGPPSVVIVQEAARAEADVIILGPHQPDRDNPLGNTADRVIRGARVPCLILPRQLTVPLQRVLVPVDTNRGARGLLETGFTWASALRARGRGAANRSKVTALHVRPDPSPKAEEVSTLAQEVGLVSDRLAHLAGLEITESIDQGDPAAVILTRMSAEPCDLLVLGTRGQRPTDGRLLGSVSSAVLRAVTVPTLLVPPSVWQREAEEPLP